MELKVVQAHQCLLTLLIVLGCLSPALTVISNQFHSNLRQNTNASSSGSLPQSSSDAERSLCPSGCHCSVHESRLKVDCYGAGLSTVPATIPPATAELQLSANRLTLDGQELQDLTQLEWLSITQNNLTYLGYTIFSKQAKLKFLDLSLNRIISSSIDNTMVGLSQLGQLNVSQNALTRISRSSFKDLRSLASLDLSRNNILFIDKQAFVMLFNLEVLDLSSNKLANLEHEWFQSLGKLLKLDISNNEIHSINNLMFWSINNLQNLNLANNWIKSVGSLSFKGLRHVNYLDLSANNITVIQEGALKPLWSLETLFLSNNPVAILNNVFLTSYKLRKLYVDNMTNLLRISSTSLLGLVGLETLTLSHSAVSFIEKDAFASLAKLQTLDLRSNKIQSLSMGSFNTIENLQMLYLKGNPWKCDCLVHWLLLWLGDHLQSHLVSPIDTMCHSPEPLNGIPLLDALDHKMVCINATITKHTEKAIFHIGSSAVLQCEIKGSPPPKLTWITPKKLRFHWSQNMSSTGENLSNTSHPPFQENNDGGRFVVLNNGDLAIRQILRGDSGPYGCTASNVLNNSTATVKVAIDAQYMVHIKIISLLVGVAVSFIFLMLTLLVNLICAIMARCGIECPCCLSCSPKAQQIRRMLESVEQYKSQQLERLRDNYTQQVQKIKDNCMQQMEKLRESYSGQAERLRDICDYGTQQIDRIRDNYYMQVSRVRDYSTFQIDKLRENYIFQRNRIRKFSAHQMYKLRENYKLQQQHLNKILENLNIESCKNGCARTDSIIFEPELPDDSDFVPLESLINKSIANRPLDRMDCESQVSAYFTPDDVGSELSCPDVTRLHHASRHREILAPLLPAHRDVAVSTTDLQQVMVHVWYDAHAKDKTKNDPEEDNSSDQISIPTTESTVTDGNIPNETVV